MPSDYPDIADSEAVCVGVIIASGWASTALLVLTRIGAALGGGLGLIAFFTLGSALGVIALVAYVLHAIRTRAHPVPRATVAALASLFTWLALDGIAWLAQ
jgi:hypothetical protein